MVRTAKGPPSFGAGWERHWEVLDRVGQPEHELDSKLLGESVSGASLPQAPSTTTTTATCGTTPCLQSWGCPVLRTAYPMQAGRHEHARSWQA